MTGKRQRYLLVCLILLACSLLIAAATPPLRAANSALPLPANLAAVSPPASMPAFGLPSPTGTTVQSADLQGKVAVIRFWATW